MPNESITKDDLNKLEENLGRMIAKGFEGVDKGFNENTEQHRQIFKILNGHSERFEKIDGRFENVNARLDVIEIDLKEIKEGMAKKYELEDVKFRVSLLEEKSGIIS